MSAYGNNPDGTPRTDYWWNTPEGKQQMADDAKALGGQWTSNGRGGMTRQGGIGTALSNAFGVGSGDPTNADRASLRGLGGAADEFANVSQGNTQALGQQMGQSNDFLRQQMMGQNSVSAEQLRQGLQQNLAAQLLRGTPDDGERDRVSGGHREERGARVTTMAIAT